MNLFTADIGNTRIKWGRCSADRVVEVFSLPPEPNENWAQVLRDWNPPPGSLWGMAGVHPERRDVLIDWLRDRLQDVRLISDYRELPLSLDVEFPEKVGIDRLLNAIGIRAWLKTPAAAILVDAGSAVTVDYVDADQVFRGGAIFPGPLLMARALNQYTAKLPLVDDFKDDLPYNLPAMPAKNTTEAIRAGIAAALYGGVDQLIQQLLKKYGPAKVWLAGGYAPLLVGLPCVPSLIGPQLTLEGIRLTLMSGISGTR